MSIEFLPGPNNLHSFRSEYYGGFGVNFYPAGPKTWNYFLGPEISAGKGQDGFRTYSSGKYNDVTFHFKYGKFLINNGVAYRPSDNVRFVTYFGTGVRYFDHDSSRDSGFLAAGHFTIIMSIKL